MKAYEERMSEETAIKLKEMGITVVITHYYKGYGGTQTFRKIPYIGHPGY
jgi:hypothetical protein